MKKRIIAAFAVLTLIIAFTSLSSARGRRGGNRRGPHHPRLGVRMLVKALNDPVVLKRAGISSAKAATIKRVIRNARKTSITLFAKMKVEHINLREAFEANTISQVRVLAIMKRIHDLRWELAKIMVATKVKTTNMLTQKQRAILKKIIRERFRRFVGRRYGRGHGPRGDHRMHQGTWWTWQTRNG